jgi:hypothetical protein
LSSESDYFTVSAIEEDQQHRLWISSNRGLFKYVPKTKEIRRYTIKNGLCTNRFVATATSSNSDGMLFFGGEKGFISFYPDKISVNASTPPVSITDFKLFDASVLAGFDAKMLADFIERRKIQLKYDQNFFSIDYAALNYLFPEANQYSYQLQGIDKNRVAAGNRTTASYTNVPPGSYSFRISGSNNDGVWNDTGDSLEIVITPPWWQTWWFYSLIVIAIASLLYAIYRYRINQIKKLFTIRSKIARDLHDDVGSTLSSIS